MSEDGIPEGTITRDEVTELACLFERYEFAFDPRSLTAREAESDFEERIRGVCLLRVHRVSAVEWRTLISATATVVRYDMPLAIIGG